MIVDLPDASRDWLWVEGSVDFAQDLAGAVFDFDPARAVLLAPGRTLTVGYRRPVGTSTSLRFAARQENATVAATALYELLGKVPDVGLISTVLLACVRGRADQLLSGLERTDPVEVIRSCGSADPVGALERLVQREFVKTVFDGRASIKAGTGLPDALARRAVHLRDTKLLLKAGKALQPGKVALS